MTAAEPRRLTGYWEGCQVKVEPKISGITCPGSIRMVYWQPAPGRTDLQGEAATFFKSTGLDVKPVDDSIKLPGGTIAKLRVFDGEIEIFAMKRHLAAAFGLLPTPNGSTMMVACGHDTMPACKADMLEILARPVE